MIPPLVTVVIPAYNAKHFIAQTVESVLSQDYPHLEVFVIDDGSSDGTAAIAGAAKDRRLRVASFPNGGLPTARNRGLDMAAGKYVAFLDSDDTWSKGKLAAQLPYLNDPEVVAVGCRMAYISAGGRRWGTCGEDPSDRSAQERIRAGQLMPFPISGIVFRTAVAREAGSFDPRLRQAEDLDFLARVACLGKITWSPAVLGSYRVHAHSMTATGFEEQRMYQAFVAMRAAGSDMPLDDFIEAYRERDSPPPEVAAAAHFRSAGLAAINGNYFSAFRHAGRSLIADPEYFLRRVKLRVGDLVRFSEHSAANRINSVTVRPRRSLWFDR